MDRVQHNRFKDAPWYSKMGEVNILIGGAGGIGSWTSLLLARAGFYIIVYDYDRIEEHNLGGQLYKRSTIGDYKVEALHTLIMELSNDDITIQTDRLDENSMSSKYCISAFDNMLARKQMFSNWVKMYGSDPEAIFIDGRLNAEQMWVYCVRGEDLIAKKSYGDLLFDDSEVEEEACTMKQTSHAAAMIASHITGFFANHITNVRANDHNLRSVPFEWSYFIPMDLLEVKT